MRGFLRLWAIYLALSAFCSLPFTIGSGGPSLMLVFLLVVASAVTAMAWQLRGVSAEDVIRHFREPPG